MSAAVCKDEDLSAFILDELEASLPLVNWVSEAIAKFQCANGGFVSTAKVLIALRVLRKQALVDWNGSQSTVEILEGAADQVSLEIEPVGGGS